MQDIIPRWEWRTFTNDLGKTEENIRKFTEGKTRESDEVYILSEVSMDNTSKYSQVISFNLQQKSGPRRGQAC